MTRAALAQVMVGLAAALPGKEVTRPLIELYGRVLSDLTDEELEYAAGQSLRLDKWFPTPARLLELARPTSDAASSADATLLRLRRLVEYCPATGPVWRVSRIREALGESAVQAFNEAGGASQLALLDDPAKGAFVRKAFAEAFTRAVQGDPASLPTAEGRHLLMGPSGDA